MHHRREGLSLPAVPIDRRKRRMPNTVPNQRLIAIHRERAASDFLGIKNSHWQAAARDLGAHALMLYLYFASNANGYLLALSPAAIRQAVGMPQSTYRDQFTKLIDRGYLVQRGDSNTYDFYETPQRAAPTEKDDTASGYDFTADAFAAPQAVNNGTAEDREININITDKINSFGGEKQVSPTPSEKRFEF